MKIKTFYGILSAADKFSNQKKKHWHIFISIIFFCLNKSLCRLRSLNLFFLKVYLNMHIFIDFVIPANLPPG